MLQWGANRDIAQARDSKEEGIKHLLIEKYNCQRSKDTTCDQFRPVLRAAAFFC